MPVRKVSFDQLTDEERARITQDSRQPSQRRYTPAKPSAKARMIARWDRKLGNQEKQDTRRRQAAMQHHRERPAKATKSYEEYMAHPIAQFVMSFSQWRNPSERRRLLREFRQ